MNHKCFKETWRHSFILTLELFKLLMETRLHVSLKLPQSGRLQYLKVDLDLLWAGVALRRLQRLNDLHHAAQFHARQPVNVQAQLVLLVVRHRQRFVIGIPVFALRPRLPEIKDRAVDLLYAGVKKNSYVM